MHSCANCKDANYCYYRGGAPSNHSCDNWSPSIAYKAYLYEQEHKSTSTINITDCKHLSELKLGRD